MLNKKKVNVVYYNGGFIDEEMLDDMSYEDIDVFVLLELELNPSEVRLVEEMPSLKKGSKLKVKHYERYGKLLLANCIDDNNKEHLINTIFLKPIDDEIDFESMTKCEFVELFEEGKVAVKSDTFEEFKNILNVIYEFNNCKERKYEDDALEDIWNIYKGLTCVETNPEKDSFYWLAIHSEDAKRKDINVITYEQFKKIMNNKSIEEFVKELKANAERIYREEVKIFMKKNNVETVSKEFTEKISKSLYNLLDCQNCRCKTIPFDEKPLNIKEVESEKNNFKVGDTFTLKEDFFKYIYGVVCNRIGFMKGDDITILEIDNENLTIILDSIFGETICVPMGKNDNKFKYLLDISIPNRKRNNNVQ